jgi:hypothetical protein
VRKGISSVMPSAVCTPPWWPMGMSHSRKRWRSTVRSSCQAKVSKLSWSAADSALRSMVRRRASAARSAASRAAMPAALMSVQRSSNRVSPW